MPSLASLTRLLTLALSIDATPLSRDSNCASYFDEDAGCVDARWGDRCSSHGLCQTTENHYMLSEECKPGHGNCAGTHTKLNISKDGKCGWNSRQTCRNSVFGVCCSKYGRCGSSPAQCDAGCQSKYGTCRIVTPAGSTSSIPSTEPSTEVGDPLGQQLNPTTFSGGSPTATALPLNGRCGAPFGRQTCKGSRFGNCCSKQFYCGSTVDFCGPDTCQSEYGDCDVALSFSSMLTSSIGLSSNSFAAAPLFNRLRSSQGSLYDFSSTSSIAPSSRGMTLPSIATSLPGVISSSMSSTSSSMEGLSTIAQSPPISPLTPSSLTIFVTSTPSIILAPIAHSRSSRILLFASGSRSPRILLFASNPALPSSLTASSSTSDMISSGSTQSPTPSPLSSLSLSPEAVPSTVELSPGSTPSSSDLASTPSPLLSLSLSPEAVPSTPELSPGSTPSSSDLASTPSPLLSLSPTPDAISSSPELSPSPPPSPSPSPSPSAPPPENLLTNPGFETGDFGPWSINVDRGSLDYYIEYDGGHTGPSYCDIHLGGGLDPASVQIGQLFDIPEGFSNVEVSAWVREYNGLNDENSINFVLQLDAISCTSVNANSADGWVQVRCARVQAAAGTHEISIKVVNPSANDRYIGIDDAIARPVE